jgi:ABC-type nickel/cobalt efflux system permease component RcnA
MRVWAATWTEGGASFGVAAWRFLGAGTVEYLMIAGSFILLMSLLLIWAVYFRSRRKSRHHHHHHHHDRHSQEPGESGARWEVKASPQVNSGGIWKFWRRRKRKRRHGHRPMNPTLAETGGLPPTRADEGPEPFP